MASTATTGSRAREAADRSATARLADQVKSQAGRVTELGFTKLTGLAEQRKEAAAQKLDVVGEIIRTYADKADSELGSLAGGVARRSGDAVESAANTLRQSSVSNMVRETRDAVARHPALSIGAASVLGFLAGRIAKGAMAQQASSTPAQAERNAEVAA